MYPLYKLGCHRKMKIMIIFSNKLLLQALGIKIWEQQMCI